MTVHRLSDRCTVLVDQRQLLIDGERVRVGSRAFDILLTLLARPGELVSKHDILSTVWTGYVVDDNNLAVHISALRRLLGPGAISTEPGRGYRLTLPGLATAATTAAASPAPAPGVLHMVGRQPDLDSLRRLVHRHPVTSLVGAAGIGKSTLAMRLVQQHGDDFPQGVAWCDLDAVVDPDAVGRGIARALALRETAAPLLDAVAQALRPSSMLIVLDGAERVIEEVARVVGLLMRAAPGTRFLVTSQLPMGLDEEQVLRLQPLSIPASTATAEQALQHGSVQLFVRRAAQGGDGFTLTDDNVPDVITICRRLDGIPLAIELAAARVGTLGTGALASLLDHRFRLLRSFNRSTSSRHATLKSALEWSLGMLTPAERVVFRRAGVFHRGFSDDLLPTVVSDSDFDAPTVTAALQSLADKSLVHPETGVPGRHRLLESTRSLAREQLRDAGEIDLMRSRHAAAVTAHFRGVTHTMRRAPHQLDTLRVALERELDNAFMAMAWSLTRDPVGACALMPALSFVAAESRFREMQVLWESTERFVDDTLPPDIHADWALGCVVFWWNRDIDAMDRWSARAAALYATLGNADGCHVAQAARLVVAARRESGVDAERARLTASVDPALSLDARRLGASALAIAASVAGDADAAARHLDETLRLARELGDSLSVANARITLLDTALGQGRVDDAIRHGEAVVEQLRDASRRGALGVAQLNLAAAYAAKGLGDAVTDLAREAWSLAVAEGLQPYWADYLALVCAMDGRAEDAARLLGYGDAGYAGYHTRRVANERAAAMRAEQLARTTLGDAGFDAARAAGGRLEAADVQALLSPD